MLWIVGGDEVLKRFVVSRPSVSGGASAREWVMNGAQVKVFDDIEAAQKVAKRLNRWANIA